MRIFLLDDDPDVRESLVRQLKRMGHEVLAVGSLKEAKEAWPKASADCALLDLMLEDGIGADFIGNIRATSPDLPILFVTGNPDHPVFRSKEVGEAVYSVIEKPVSLNRLKTMIEWADERRRERHRPTRDEMEKAVPKEDELKKLIQRSSWQTLFGYALSIGFVVILLTSLMAGVFAWRNRSEEAFGFIKVMDRLEGYLRRDEMRELQRDKQQRLPLIGPSPRN